MFKRKPRINISDFIPNIDLTDITREEYNIVIKYRRFIPDILKNNEIYSLNTLIDILNNIKKLNGKACLEKYNLIFGKELGLQKWAEYRSKIAMTKDNMIKKYGEELGLQKWQLYCDRQAYTNTLEYKSKKYNMTENDFLQYNKSRATTKDNMIKKYGEELGLQKWQLYCDRQAYTNTLEYLGEERYKLVNFRKSHTLDSYILRYGDENIAREKLKKYFTRKSNYHSKISQELFWNIYDYFTLEEKNKIYFAEKNHEYTLIMKNKTYCYDFVCSKLKLCIEFHGDVYHGNPKKFKPNDFLSGRGQTTILVKNKWKEDEIKKQAIIDNRKYEYIVIWESDYRKNKEDILQKIRGYIEKLRIIR